MIRKYLPSLALAMAFIILFSTIGVAVNVHTCNFKGTYSVSVSTELSCCGMLHSTKEPIAPTQVSTKGDSTKTEKKCCDDGKEYSKVEVQSEKANSETDSPVPSIISFNLIFEILYRFNLSDLFDFTPSKKGQLQAGAWSVHGLELLRQIQVFLK